MKDIEKSLQMPRLVASTSDLYQTGISESHSREEQALDGKLGNGLDYRTVVSEKERADSNVFRSVEWTADGTSLVAVTEDNCLRTFIAPPDLLTSDAPHSLRPYSISSLPSTPFCISPYPLFTLSDPTTTLTLTALHSQPIHLRNLLYPHIAASYPLIHPTTEKYLTPHSLIWTHPATHFLAGTDSQIHLFDVSRYNSGPLESFVTGKKRKSGVSKKVPHAFSSSSIQSSRDSSNTRAIISTLTLHHSTSLLAAGTYSRKILIYSSPFQDGELVNSISLPSKTGNGVISLLFTDSGNQIVVAERNSDVIYIYDLRFTIQPWARLTGRKGRTNQKLGVSFVSDYANGRFKDAVLAGGTDGVVNVWTPFAQSTGEDVDKFMEPVESFKAAEDPVTAVAVHSCGSVLATSSGQRKNVSSNLEDSGSESDSDDELDKSDVNGIWDNGVKVWAS